MWRTVLGIITGLVAWALIASLLDIGLRHALPGYQQAEPTFAFTVAMMIARLAIAAAASLATGAMVQLIAGPSRLAPWVVGGVMLLLFIPVHIRIGLRLPIWYHLVFLTTLAPLVVLGARLPPRASPIKQQPHGI
jgi:hypothetical protein